MNKVILAMDMGGTNIKGGLFDSDCISLGETAQISMPSFCSREEILGTLGSFVEMFARRAQIHAVSISIPGPFRYAEGASEMTHKYAAIRGVPLRSEIRSRGGLPVETPVEFLSDANAYLIGERFFGAGQGCDDLAVVTLGTGLGYSVMEDGRIVTNKNGRPYDLLCFSPFRDGVLEDIVSGSGIAREYERRTGKRTSAREMAMTRDDAALDIYYRMGSELGKALLPRMRKHHTCRLIVGGQIAYSLELFHASLAQVLPGVGVQQAKNIPDAALFGAAVHAVGLEKPWLRL